MNLRDMLSNPDKAMGKKTGNKDEKSFDIARSGASTPERKTPEGENASTQPILPAREDFASHFVASMQKNMPQVLTERDRDSNEEDKKGKKRQPPEIDPTDPEQNPLQNRQKTVPRGHQEIDTTDAMTRHSSQEPPRELAQRASDNTASPLATIKLDDLYKIKRLIAQMGHVMGYLDQGKCLDACDQLIIQKTYESKDPLHRTTYYALREKHGSTAEKDSKKVLQLLRKELTTCQDQLSKDKELPYTQKKLSDIINILQVRNQTIPHTLTSDIGPSLPQNIASTSDQDQRILDVSTDDKVKKITGINATEEDLKTRTVSDKKIIKQSINIIKRNNKHILSETLSNGNTIGEIITRALNQFNRFVTEIESGNAKEAIGTLQSMRNDAAMLRIEKLIYSYDTVLINIELQKEKKGITGMNATEEDLKDSIVINRRDAKQTIFNAKNHNKHILSKTLSNGNTIGEIITSMINQLDRFVTEIESSNTKEAIGTLQSMRNDAAMLRIEKRIPSYETALRNITFGERYI